jgi:hypothetical protein
MRALLAMIMLLGAVARADDRTDAETFFLSIIGSYSAQPPTLTFPTTDPLFALDNGEEVTRAELQEKWWPEVAKRAFVEGKSFQDYSAHMKVVVMDPRQDKKFVAKLKRFKQYAYQDGDLLIHGDEPQAGQTNIVKYEKAFQFLVRKIVGRWTVLAIGG